MVPRNFALVDLALLQTHLVDSVMHLYQNDVTPTPALVLGDLTVATFTGYAGVDLAAWGNPFLDAENMATILSPLATFRPTGTAIQNVIYGWYILDDGGLLVAAGRFENAPLPMGATSNVISIVGKMRSNVAA